MLDLEIRAGDTGQRIPCFYSPIDHNIDVQSVFPWAPKLARKCENEHWYASGADRRSVARAYGHVITKFSRMGRLPHFLSYKARAWSFAIKGWTTRHQICRQDFVKVNLSTTKNPA